MRPEGTLVGGTRLGENHGLPEEVFRRGRRVELLAVLPFTRLRAICCRLALAQAQFSPCRAVDETLVAPFAKWITRQGCDKLFCPCGTHRPRRANMPPETCGLLTSCPSLPTASAEKRFDMHGSVDHRLQRTLPTTSPWPASCHGRDQLRKCLSGKVALCARSGGISLLHTATALATRIASLGPKPLLPTIFVLLPIVPSPALPRNLLNPLVCPRSLWIPDVRTNLRHSFGTLPSFVPHTSLAVMQPDHHHSREPGTQQVEDGANAVWQTHNVHVVQECKEEFAHFEFSLHLLQRVMDCQAEQQWHEWVALFPTLMLTKLCLCPSSSSHVYDDGEE